MKIRSDFVTNSSSSSFILAFKDKEDGFSQIIKELSYNPEALGEVLKDFNEAKPINFEKFINSENPEDFEGYEEYEEIIANIEAEISEKLLYRNGWEASYFRQEWEKNNPDKKSCGIYDSPEYKEKMKQLMDKEIKEFLEGIKNTPYVVELEYEDHYRIGSELEHDILPNCEFVYKIFNYH